MNQVQSFELIFNDRTQIKDFTYLGISTNAKGIGIETYDDNAIKSMKTINVNKGEFYIFYPIKNQVVVAFGEGENNKLGTGTASSTPPKLCQSTKELFPTKIRSSYKYAITVDKEGNLHNCG